MTFHVFGQLQRSSGASIVTLVTHEITHLPFSHVHVVDVISEAFGAAAFGAAQFGGTHVALFPLALVMTDSDVTQQFGQEQSSEFAVAANFAVESRPFAPGAIVHFEAVLKHSGRTIRSVITQITLVLHPSMLQATVLGVLELPSSGGRTKQTSVNRRI